MAKEAFTPTHGNENSGMMPAKNDQLHPGPDAHPNGAAYFHNVAGNYIKVSDLSVDHLDANQTSHSGTPQNFRTEPLNSEAIGLGDPSNSNPSGTRAKPEASDYGNPPGSTWNPGDGTSA